MDIDFDARTEDILEQIMDAIEQSKKYMLHGEKQHEVEKRKAEDSLSARRRLG
jgi:hypothetical protein